MDLSHLRSITEGIRAEVRKVVVGQDPVIDLLLTSLLAGGHVLLEGVPGTAKTLLTQAFAAGIALKFGRIQFTPDLMLGDVLGTNLFNFQTNSFVLTKGPIFTQVLLADEINRTPPKTQAALLQAMNERFVTIDAKDYQLGDEFLVVATQNPIEQQGTYPLPEAQLDRFLFKIVIDYPSREDELEIVWSSRPPLGDAAACGFRARCGGERRRPRARPCHGVEHPPVRRAGGVHRRCRAGDARARLDRDRGFDACRQHAGVRRSGIRQATSGPCDFVIPDDVKALAIPLMRHRIVLSPSAEIEGLGTDQVLRDILDQPAAPR